MGWHSKYVDGVRIMKLRALLSLLILLLALGYGCSGADPTVSAPSQYPGDAATVSAPGRQLWGIWNFSFNPENLSLEPVPARHLLAHYKITDWLLPPACDDCIEIKVNSFDPVAHILDADITMRNPTQVTGRDVRGILYTNAAGHQLANADSWTGTWDIPGGLNINPFKAFAKTDSTHSFLPSAEYTENYLIKVPSPPQWAAIVYAVDASWPGNCNEPYSIENFNQDLLSNETAAQADVSVDVLDWQDDVDSVTISATEITGDDSTALTHLSGNTWGTTITNNNGASAGEYSALISATSPNAGINTLYQYVTIVVTDTSIPGGYALTWGSDSLDSSMGIASDADGNIYVTGTCTGVTDFDPGPGTEIHDPASDGDAYLSKFNSAGEFQWVRNWGGFCPSSQLDVAESGAIYVVGAFAMANDFDPGPGQDLRSPPGSNWGSFLMKFDTTGAFYWADTWGPEDSAQVEYFQNSDLATDSLGYVYVTGHFAETADLDPGPGEDNHTSNGYSDIYLSKIDPDGNFQWARTWGGSGIYSDYGSPKESGYSVGVDGSDNIYVAGTFGDTVDFDPGPDVDARSVNWGAFLSKYSSSGEYIWAVTYPDDDSADAMSYGAAVDDSGNIYFSGMFWDTVDFDPGPGVAERSSTGSADSFVVKLDTDGSFLWVESWGGADYEWTYGICAGGGNVLITGAFEHEVDFDPGPGNDTHVSSGDFDIYLLELDSSGVFQWANTWGGDSIDYGHAATINNSNDIFTTGIYMSTSVDFDPGPGTDIHYGNGSSDCYLIKFLSNGEW